MDDFKSHDSSANVYMIKSQWNTTILNGSIPKVLLFMRNERMMDNYFFVMK